MTHGVSEPSRSARGRRLHFALLRSCGATCGLSPSSTRRIKRSRRAQQLRRAQAPYIAIPRFWSDQYDAKLQMVGLSEGYDAHAIRGSMDGGKILGVPLSCGASLVAIDSVNRPGDQLIPAAD